jgi:hypothetical protein
MPGRPLQMFVDALGRAKMKVQAAGGVLAIAAFGLVYLLAPSALTAQLAAALAGVALIFFAQFFAYLQKLPPENRGALSTAGAASLVVCFAAALGVAGFSLAAHRGTPSGEGGAPGPSASAGPSASGSPEAAFLADDPNRIEIRTGNVRKRWRKLVVRVEKIWTLTPEKTPTEPVDVNPAHDVTLLVRETPYSDENPLRPGEIVLTLRAQLPPETATEDLVDAGPEKGMVWRTKFTPQAKDYVFWLRFTLVEAGGKQTEAGELLYLPDFRTSYNTPTSAANLAVLREIQAMQAPKSQKLVKLLADNVKPPEGSK